MNDSYIYIYVITALMPLAGAMVVFQVNPYHALVLRGIRNLHVLAYNEIPEDKQIRMVGAVGN